MTSTSKFTVQRTTRFSRITAIVLLLVVAAMVLAPVWAERDTIRLLTEVLYYLALAQMWNLLAGYGGMVSVGQQGFVGLGAYGVIFFAVILGMNPFWAIPLAGVVALLLAIPTAAVTFRLSGAYFAVGTWVVAEVFRLFITNSQALGSGTGISLAPALIQLGMPAPTREAITLWIGIALGVGACVAVYWLLCTRRGLALTALRDNEAAAESVGVGVRRMKWFVFLAAAAGCGMVGGLYAMLSLSITPSAAFSIEWTAFMIFIVVIGGIGTIEGPIIGTIVFFVLREAMSGYGSWYLVVLGLLAVIAMMFAREGVWGIIARKYNVYIFPTKRRVHNPQGEYIKPPEQTSS